VSDLTHIPNLAEEIGPSARPNVKRHLIGALLSALVPGAGQLFLGREKKAVFLFLALLVVSGGFRLLRLPRSYAGLIFLAWMCLLLSLSAIYDALLARDTSDSQRMSRWWIFAGIPILYLSVNLIFTLLLIGSGFRALKFASSSMEPTIFAGDKFIYDKQYYQRHPPDRDDLALVSRPDAVTIKRIIGVGGDTIQGRDRWIFVNGQLQTEPFVLHKFRTSNYQWLDTFGPVAIPPGKYFVMGDNRDISLDSRYADFGLLDEKSIVGKPLYGYRIIGHPHSWELN
jgi:signal peptidase I